MGENLEVAFAVKGRRVHIYADVTKEGLDNLRSILTTIEGVLEEWQAADEISLDHLEEAFGEGQEFTLSQSGNELRGDAITT